MYSEQICKYQYEINYYFRYLKRDIKIRQTTITLKRYTVDNTCSYCCENAPSNFSEDYFSSGDGGKISESMVTTKMENTDVQDLTTLYACKLRSDGAFIVLEAQQ